MLNPSDVYVSGGSDNLLACWTDKVTKYDASSFYNWEQDNLPLHDLDERTHLLWEKFGHPTSSLGGMSFIVSGDATSSCNPLYFTTLSACIDALPEVINCPILIEVASFGSLGGLNLSNKSFGPRGALEIINRNCAFQAGTANNGAIYGAGILDGVSDYGLVSSLTPGFDIASVGAPGRVWDLNATTRELSGFPSLAVDAIRSRLYTRNSDGTEIFIASGLSGNRYADSRFVNPYVFAKRCARDFDRLTGALSSTATPWNTSPSQAIDLSAFNIVAFDRNPTTEMETYDVSTINSITNTEIQWGLSKPGLGVLDYAFSVKGCVAFAYFNHLDYIKVKNCDGPIYLRNFNVDCQHSRDNGIEVTNSRVHLERTSVSRANKVGLYVSDSDVDLARGFVSYRNYDLDGSDRTGVPFLDKIAAYQTQDSYGKGVYALNSTINLLSTYDRTRAQYIELSSTPASAIYSDYFSRATASGISLPLVTTEELYCFSRNDIGIHCVNSKIFGGTNERPTSINSAQSRQNTSNQLHSELNTEAGIKLDNSVFSYNGRLAVDGNYYGIDAVNSEIEVNALAARYNQSTGIKISNCDLKYNKDLFLFTIMSNPANIGLHYYAQLAGIQNGQDILAHNSTIAPVYTSSMPSTYGMVYTSGCFGKEDNSDKLLPSVHLKGGSNADLIHTHMVREPGAGNTSSAQYGLLIHVEDESTVTARGSSEAANVFLGPTSRNDSVNVAGLYANNGSTIKLQGPTTIGRFGVDVLAEDNSNIEITPHQTNNGSLLVSAFDLSSDANHTMVELHSTRACLVANRNSNILMENVGDYQNYWLSGAYASSIGATYDYANDDYEVYTSGGYIQFYPNANVDATAVVANPTNVQTPQYVFQTVSNQPVKHNLIHTLGNDISGVSTGGMCIRAIENSLVQANNVHFPATWPITSSVAYDLEGDDPLPGPNCSRLFIWNIADNSLLKASYLTVSALHPRDSGYHGPSGTWGISGAPSSTPDTSSLSVLDYYGQGTDNPFGKSVSAENFGAFRLYFSTDPAANFLVASSAGRLEGLARQVFAQGYNFSGNLIASGTDDFEASAQYISVFQRGEDGNIHPSGFYYASAMVASPETVKAVLDDSALNAFANAKHNTVGKSGLAKVVEGYYATSALGGDSYNEYDYGTGLASINNFDLKKDN